jgi:hypothetical protein
MVLILAPVLSSWLIAKVDVLFVVCFLNQC